MSRKGNQAKANLHAITHGAHTPRKLPDSVTIRESQAAAFELLLPQQQRLMAELAKVNKRIDGVIAEFDGDYGLSAQDMNRYQLAGNNEIVLVKPEAQEVAQAPEAPPDSIAPVE